MLHDCAGMWACAGLVPTVTGVLAAGEREAQDKKQRKAANKQKAIAKSAGVTKRPHKPKQKGIRIRKGAVVKVCSHLPGCIISMGAYPL